MSTKSLTRFERPNKPRPGNGQTVTCNQAPQSPVFTWGAQDQCRAGRVDVDLKDQKKRHGSRGVVGCRGITNEAPQGPQVLASI